MSRQPRRTGVNPVHPVPMEDRLIFVISPPRAGSTLLQRMLGSHREVMTHPEPHLVTPLAYLGYHDIVDRAPYDHINAAEAIRLFVSHLPNGEADYLDALRAYTDTMYGRMLAASDRSRFLDKTPAYALVWPFLTQLYPNAKYIVLTRHPLAVFSSYANSFFDGDWERAREYNPIVERYVPAMARLLHDAPVPLAQVAYEDLVRDPSAELARIFSFLDLEDDPEAVNYGARSEQQSGPGDPISVNKHGRPVTASLHKWAAELRDDDRKRALAEEMIASIADEDLVAWAWPRDRVFAALAEVNGVPAPKPVRNNYTFQRRVMLALKKNIHERPHGKVVRKIRYYCDVLLRE